MLSKLFAFGAVAQAVVLRKQPSADREDRFATGDDNQGVNDRNAIFDCANGVEANVGKPNANNVASTRRLLAKAKAIGDASADMDSSQIRASTKVVQEYLRHAAQDCENDCDLVKSDLDSGPISRENFSGPDSDVEAALEKKETALKRANEIRVNIFNEPTVV